MPVVHIVLFEFKPSVGKAIIDDVCRRMLELQQTCLHPESKSPYIISTVGGRDISPEGHQGGFTHGFVSQFASEEDRDYYLEEDTVHLGFVKSLEGVIENVRVVDFTPGAF